MGDICNLGLKGIKVSISDLLNTKALSGDLNEIKESLETKYEQVRIA